MTSLTRAIDANVAAALSEDIGDGDWTAQLIAPEKTSKATVISRDAAVVCGAPWFDATFRKLDPGVNIEWLVAEGTTVTPGQTLCRLAGKSRALLSGERTGLNFVQLLSAVATATRRHVDAVAGTRARIVDTRKTLPGLRIAEKYAVRMGGGINHRIGLFDAILIKENHIAAAGSVSAAVARARQIAPASVWMEVEVENFVQLEEAIAAGAKMILLDNMNPDQMREAVRIAAGRAELEASGGITLANVRDVAETGVDRISIGSLTKDIKAVDLSMRFE